MTIKNQPRKNVACVPVMVLLALGCFQVASIQFASTAHAQATSSRGNTESSSNWAILKGEPGGMKNYLDANTTMVSSAGNNLSRQAAIDHVLFKLSLSLHDLDKYNVGTDEYIKAGEKSQRLYAQYGSLVSDLRKQFDKTFRTYDAPSQFLSVSSKSISALDSKFSSGWLKTGSQTGVADLFKVFALPQFEETDFNDPARRRVILGQLSYQSILQQRRQILTAFELLCKADSDGLRLALDGGSGRSFFAQHERSQENAKLARLREQYNEARQKLTDGRIGSKIGMFSVGATGALVASFANAGEAEASAIGEQAATMSAADTGWARGAARNRTSR